VHLTSPYITTLQAELKQFLSAPPERKLLVPVGE
jgi:quinol monooxygenase YgiN